MLFPDRPINADHIHAFCGKFSEGYRVEYKSTFDASVRDKLPKIISSFANGHGGVIVVGVNAKNGVPQPPFEGFVPSEREEYPLTVENICLQGIYPPVLPQTITVASDVADHVFLVIEVDESGQAPHAIENSTKVYVRTGNAGNPYDLAAVDSILELVKRRGEPFERRERLLSRAKKRFNTYLDTKRMDTSGHRTDLGPLLQLSVGPRFPSRPLCRQEQVSEIVRRRGTPWRGAVFPFPGRSPVSQRESVISLDAARGTSCIFVEVNVWGMIFYGGRLSSEEVSAPGINASKFLGYVLFFVRHAGDLLHVLGYHGPIMTEITIGPILRVSWLQAWSGYQEAMPGSELDEEVSITVSTSSEAVQHNPDSVAAEIFRQVFYSVNLPGLVEPPVQLEKLIRRGYDFNAWPQPEKQIIT
jgi:hypothetical protein